VFILPSGHSNLELYFSVDGGKTGWYLGRDQCRISPVIGPGYINDPDGMHSAYVPEGSIGMAICGSTTTLTAIRLQGYDINNTSYWMLFYYR
jgi:hypothetical protein